MPETEPRVLETYVITKRLLDAVCEALEELPRRQTNQLFEALGHEIQANLEAEAPKIII